MKGIPALLGATDRETYSDREAIIASKIEEYGVFGDVILREDLFGHTYLWNVGHAAHIVTTSTRFTTSTRPQSPLVLAEYDITEELCRQWRPDMDEQKAMRLDLTVPHRFEKSHPATQNHGAIF